jgi:hypothetical protein
MQKTAYKNPILSPFQTMWKRAFDVRREDHPAMDEIKKSLGTYNLTATFEEDREALEMFKGIPGLIAFTCVLKKSGKIIGKGRSLAVLGGSSRFVERTSRFAFNASLIDAVSKATKVLDGLDFQKDEEEILEYAYASKESTEPKITDKQKGFLTELVYHNIQDNQGREMWLSQIDSMSLQDASEAIQNFMK